MLDSVITEALYRMTHRGEASKLKCPACELELLAGGQDLELIDISTFGQGLEAPIDLMVKAERHYVCGGCGVRVQTSTILNYTLTVNSAR